MRAVREAYRSFRSAPGIWTAIILSLALGTGANIGLFSIVNGLMLRPLPVQDPDSLAIVRTTAGGDAWSYPVWQEIQLAPGLFRGAAAWASQTFNTAPPGRSSIVDGLFVSGEFFEVLGIAPAHGRLFNRSDDRRGGSADGLVAVISDRFWQKRFAGAVDVIGQPLLVDGKTVTIVGVTPRGFLGPEVGTAFDVAFPLGSEPLLRAIAFVNVPGAWWLNIMVRLEPGQSRFDATLRLRAFEPALRERLETLTGSRDAYPPDPFDLLPAGYGISPLRERYRQPLAVLSVVAGMVLLIACANIANLLLVRGLTRQKEVAVRRALGASSGALVKAMMAESAVLIGAGCGAGVLLASWGSAVFMSHVSMGGDAAALDLSLDWRVLAFACAVAGLTLVASSLLPAIRAGRIDAAQALMHGQRVMGAAGYRGAHALIVVQIAFTLTMLVAAGLFVRTFESLLSQPLGFEREKVLAIRVDAAGPVPAPERALELYDRLQEAALRVPGVERASLSAMTPMGGTTVWQILFELPGSSTPFNEEERTVTANVISPGFFATFGTRIVSGREFLPSDQRRSMPVTVVNQAFVAKYLGGGPAVGRRVRQVGFVGRPSVDREIVGVVEDAAYLSLRAMNRPTMYVPLAQRPTAPAVIFVGLRAATLPPALLGNSAIDALATVAPESSFSIATVADQVNGSIAQERLVAMLSGFFAVLALLLAGLGLYGVTSHAVGQRRRELGIRLALGARPGGVIRMVLGRVAVQVAVGIAIGTGLSMWLAPFVASLLYGLSPRDPLTLAVAASTIGLVGGLAAFLPARHAASVDPAEALRGE